ncbi:hypothetical protein KSE_07110 [Kitasatospora setae KM-6054]|uniref:Cupin type-2 domain-containing protein n=2 Tax=Streptomycetaceae TaxID=2062 RepID=E4N5S0_KITSK|nr:hypothetical protein KSE_07110 [Kitasatospora setae KM-6054]
MPGYRSIAPEAPQAAPDPAAPCALLTAAGSVGTGGAAAVGVIDAAPVLAAGFSAGPLDLTAVGRPGGTSLSLRRVDIAPGQSTGWHYHPGPMVVIVGSGTLTLTSAEGTVERPTGSAFVEAAGPGHVHNGHNTGSETVSLFTLSFMPPGVPMSFPVPAPDWALG